MAKRRRKKLRALTDLTWEALEVKPGDGRLAVLRMVDEEELLEDDDEEALDGQDESGDDDGLDARGVEHVAVQRERRAGGRPAAAGSPAGWLAKGAPQPPARMRKQVESALRQHDREALVRLLTHLVWRFPDVKVALQDQWRAVGGTRAELVQSAREAIREATADASWSNHWTGEGNLADYSRVREQLQSMMERRHFEEVVEVGLELLHRGLSQVGQSHDGGEAGRQLSECMTIVFDALTRTKRPKHEQILWAIDARSADLYSALDWAAESFWKRAKRLGRNHWSRVADVLAERLEALVEPTEDYTSRSSRDELSNLLVDALVRAKRNDEVTALLVQEAPRTRSYVRLVGWLVEQDEFVQAETYAVRGLDDLGEDLPGLAGTLLNQLEDIWVRQGNRRQAVALRAERLFVEPSLSAYTELRTMARQARCWQAVRPWVVRFLETGCRPGRRKGKGRSAPAKDWPLPPVDVPIRSRRPGRPASAPEVLLEIALDEKLPEDALRWFDRVGSRGGWYGGDEIHDRVAALVAKDHPERALALWKRNAETAIARTDPREYANAAASLRKMRKVYRALGRSAEFESYLAEIREAHRRKRRLMAILDGLDRKPIVSRRRRRTRGARR